VGIRLIKKNESTAKQEVSTADKWCVEFGDIYNNAKKEYYATEADAKARYDELAERGDIEWVEKPVLKAESKAENAPAKNEGRVTSYFVLRKNAKLDAIEKIVATLEDAILNGQTVETAANPDGTVSLEIYGRMSPDEVARAIRLPGQLGTSYVDLAINIEG